MADAQQYRSESVDLCVHHAPLLLLCFILVHTIDGRQLVHSKVSELHCSLFSRGDRRINRLIIDTTA